LKGTWGESFLDVQCGKKTNSKIGEPGRAGTARQKWTDTKKRRKEH